MTQVPLKGFLRSYSVPKILVSLNRQRATGTLSVASQGVTKKVYLNKGTAIFASSTYEDDRLGEILLKAGRITVRQYDESVEMLKKTGRRQGVILVELGYLTPKDLFWGVKHQVKEVIRSLFYLRDGTFEFAPGEASPDEVITLNMSMANLIYEGVKRIEDWTRIRQEMPDTESVLKLSDDPLSLFQEIELTPEDRKVLSLVDGKRAIKKVMEDSALKPLDALKTLYVLWSIGIITEQLSSDVSLTIDEILKPAPEKEGSFAARVNGIYEKLGSASHYELLEIDPSAGPDLIKDNYYRLAKEFHPDRHYDFTDAEMKDKLAAVFDAITDAYNALKAKDAAPVQSREDARGLRAEEILRMGVEETKKGGFQTAVEFLSEAVRIMPEKAGYWNHLSFALSKLPGRLGDAEEAILRALELEPSNSGYHTNLGMLYLKTGKKDRAGRQFEKALSLDPGNQRARKALTSLG